MTPQISVFLAALVASLLAELISPLHGRKYSRISLSVPAVVTMVPGVMFYRSMAYLSNGNLTDAISGMVDVFLIFLALGSGLVISRFVTDENWLFNRDLQKVRTYDSHAHLR